MSQSIRLRRAADTVDGQGNIVDPVPLAEAISYLKLEVGDDDALVTKMLRAAKKKCESVVNRSFVTTRWELTFGHFPLAGAWPGPLFAPGTILPFGVSVDPRDWSIRLPRPPLISVDSIGYIDLSGNAQTINPVGTGVVVATGTPGYLSPAYGSPFPWVRPGIAAVTIGYTAGYGTDPAAVPESAYMGIQFLTSIYYNNRSSDVKIPDAFYRMLDDLRWGD